MTLTSGRLYALLATAVAVLAIVAAFAVAAAAGSRGEHPPPFFGFLAHLPPNTCRPNFRWWWPGTEVTASELDREIRAMKQAGFGGAEVSDLEEGVPPGRWEWGTPAWFADVAHALRTAVSDGFRLDLTVGPVYPMASPAVSGSHIDLSEHELVYGRQDLVGPSVYVGPPPDNPAVAGPKKLLAVTAAQPVNPTSTSASPGPVMLNPATAVDLTPDLDGSGTLHWSVPPGHWFLFGFWLRPSGQTAENGYGFLTASAMDQTPPGALPGEMLLVDPFRQASADAALGFLSQNMMSAPVAALWRRDHGNFFEDSLENATGLGSDLFWTPGFLSEFRTRRGYPLTRFLPVLFARGVQAFIAGNPYAPPDFAFPNDLSVRIRNDYFTTLTDLFIDDHLRPLEEWARRYGMVLRHQSYGITIDASRAEGAGGISETESLEAGDPQPPGSAYADGALDFYRVAAGAAHIYGSRLVTEETGDVIHDSASHASIRPYGEEPSDYWWIVSHSFAGGVTRPGIQGFAYASAPPGFISVTGVQSYQWPGWNPWGGTPGYAVLPVTDAWNENWPQFPFWRPFADYMARACLVLTQGTPRVDLVIYRDNFTGDPTIVTGSNPYFDGRALARRGYTYEYTDPVTLASRGSVRDRRLFPDGPAYKALIIDQSVDRTPGMPAATAARIDRFARGGLPVVFVGALPMQGTSALSPAAEDRAVRAAVADMLSLPNVRHVSTPSEVAAALSSLGVVPDSSWSRAGLVHAVHRQTGDADYWYLWNEGTQRVRFVGTFETRGAPYWLDLWNDRAAPIADYRQRGRSLTVPVDLGPEQAVVLAVERSVPAPLHIVATNAQDASAGPAGLTISDTRAGSYSATLSDHTVRKVTIGSLPSPMDVSPWRLHVDRVGPSGHSSVDLELTRLADWENIDSLRYASGTGTYRASVRVPRSWLTAGHGVYLSLGSVYGAVRLAIDGRLVTSESLALPDERWSVRELMHPGVNEIRVVLATTLLNELVGLARSGDPRYARFLSDSTEPYGLVGPVTLTPFGQSVISTAGARHHSERTRGHRHRVRPQFSG